MLVLSRNVGEKLICRTPGGDELEICIVAVRGNRVRVGIEAPTDIAVHRKEVQDAIDRESESGS